MSIFFDVGGNAEHNTYHCLYVSKVDFFPRLCDHFIQCRSHGYRTFVGGLTETHYTESDINQPLASPRFHVS